MDDDFIRREDAEDLFRCDLGEKDQLVSKHGVCIEAVFRLESIPAADVVEVVRCKDCIFSEEYLYDGEKNLTCNHEGGLFRDVSDTDFCSGGVKREVDDG